MIMNDKFTFIVAEKVSNGMGGYTTKDVEKTSFHAKIIPQNATVMLKEYGLVTTEAYKLISNDKIATPLESLILKHNEQKYKILQHLSLKLNIFLVEKVN